MDNSNNNIIWHFENHDIEHEKKLRQEKEDEELAIKIQKEDLEMFTRLEEEVMIRQIQELKELEQKEKEAEIRRKENEERRILRETQDKEYLETLKKPEPKPQPKPIEIVKPIPPSHFICPITNQIMTTPLCDTENNISYEKSAILKYLRENQNKNLEGKHVNHSKLIINNELKSEISLWKRENPLWVK